MCGRYRIKDTDRITDYLAPSPAPAKTWLQGGLVSKLLEPSFHLLPAFDGDPVFGSAKIESGSLSNHPTRIVVHHDIGRQQI